VINKGSDIGTSRESEVRYFEPIKIKILEYRIAVKMEVDMGARANTVT
jgi:hypothetical protein